MRPVALGLTITLPLSALVGCARPSESGAAIGATSGALLGAGTGLLIDDSAEAAVIGGLVGAAAGGIIGYAVGRQMENREQTLEQYPEYQQQLAQPGVNEVIDIRQVRVTPATARPNDNVEINLVHAFVGPTDQVQPFQITVRIVNDQGQVLISQAQTHEFANGTYASTINLQIPREMPPGRHTLEVHIATSRVRDFERTPLQVL